MTFSTTARLSAIALLLASHALAAAPDDDEARQRAQIEQGRARVEKQFQVDQEVCYHKFAVNDCLAEVKTVRRKALSDYQRQELALNEAKRQRDGAARLKEIEDRQSPEKLQARQDKIRQSEEAAQRRQDRVASKAPAKAASAARRQHTMGGSTAHTADDQREAEEAYQRKLDDAKKRRESRDRRAAERTKPPASGLPAPH